MALETFKVLALSTAHVSREVGSVLDRMLRNNASLGTDHWSYWVVGSEWNYGWWIWADLDAIEELPDCLAKCLYLAREQGCKYVQFDCDVEPISELQTFEW